MTLEPQFALMTVAAIFAVLWPLSRGNRTQDDGSEAAVYKDQLTEIDRDARRRFDRPCRGGSGASEISRRLLRRAMIISATHSLIERPAATRGGNHRADWPSRCARLVLLSSLVRRVWAISCWHSAPWR